MQKVKRCVWEGANPRFRRPWSPEWIETELKHVNINVDDYLADKI